LYENLSSNLIYREQLPTFTNFSAMLLQKELHRDI
jgi:hypothetical protein